MRLAQALDTQSAEQGEEEIEKEMDELIFAPTNDGGGNLYGCVGENAQDGPMPDPEHSKKA